jgi:type II secretory pathway pseudopilin PulG
MEHIGQRKGFSLIEALVAASLFMIIIVIVSGLYIRVLGLQRRASGAARVQENALFVVETVAREVRISTIDNPVSDCSSGSDPVPGSTITITPAHIGAPVVYRLTNGIVEREEAGEVREITSPEVFFDDLTFIVNCSAGDDEQSRVTLVMTVRNNSLRPQNQTPMTLQTTVVSRDLVTDLTN